MAIAAALAGNAISLVRREQRKRIHRASVSGR